MSAIFERGLSVKEKCLEEWNHSERPKKEAFAFWDGFNACHSKLVVEMISDVNKALKIFISSGKMRVNSVVLRVNFLMMQLKRLKSIN